MQKNKFVNTGLFLSIIVTIILLTPNLVLFPTPIFNETNVNTSQKTDSTWEFEVAQETKEIVTELALENNEDKVQSTQKQDIKKINEQYQIPEQDFTHTRGQEIEKNNNPANATFLFSNPDNMQGSINPESDVDWYYIKLVNEEDDRGGLQSVQNLTITSESLSGIAQNLGVSIFGWFDINQNDEIDYDTELMMMKMEIFRIGTQNDVMFINSFNSHQIRPYYYIKIESDGETATYNFRVNRNLIEPLERNQDIEYAGSISKSSTHTVNMGTDSFDWFYLKKIFNPENVVGINFSLKIEIEDYPSRPSVQLSNGTIIQFITVLHIFIYHDDAKVGNSPVFPFQFSDHEMISKQSYTKLNHELEFADIITLPTELFEWTYIGFYAESFGINTKKPGIKYYPIISEMAEYSSNTFCTYLIDEASVSKITRPELSRISVKSIITNSVFGRTYDTYRYSVEYKQEDGYPPLETDISVFGLEGEIREKMKKITPGTPADKIYETGCVFQFLLSGLLLGEGDHHVFQFHFRDQNTYANGTIEVGKTWHGPYVSNNLRPYIRPSAPTYIALNEDDNTTFIDLFTIFEDVDINDKLNFTLSDPALKPENRIWSKTYSDKILEVQIVNQSRMRIDLKPNKNGIVVILLNVTDKNNFYLESSFEFTIKVIPMNDPPQIIKYFSKLNLKEDESNSNIKLKYYFVDRIDNDKLSFRVDNNNNINVTIAEDTTVTLTPAPNWHGVEFIDFYATDGFEEVTDYLKVVVKSINDIPQLDIEDTMIFYEDQWVNFTINASDAADNETVTIMHNLTDTFPVLLTKPSKYGYSFDNYTGYFTFKPINHLVGVYYWNISAIDVNNEINFAIVKLIIRNINDPPNPRILYPATGSRYLTTDKIIFRGLASDPDSILNETDFIWFSSLDGDKRKIGSGRTLPPQLYENGSHTIILAVGDEEFTVQTTIIITVFSINQEVDSDEDGIPDYWENLYFMNTKDPHDAEGDYDRDTFSNWEEFKAGTDPMDQNSMPDKHITKETAGTEEDTTNSVILFIVIIVIVVVIILFLFFEKRRRKRKAEEEKRLSTDDIIGMGKKGKDQDDFKMKVPKTICLNCGHSIEVLTLNRPVVVTCPDCGKRGAVYK